jgi:hypothetical protein
VFAGFCFLPCFFAGFFNRLCVWLSCASTDTVPTHPHTDVFVCMHAFVHSRPARSESLFLFYTSVGSSLKRYQLRRCATLCVPFEYEFANAFVSVCVCLCRRLCVSVIFFAAGPAPGRRQLRHGARSPWTLRFRCVCPPRSSTRVSHRPRAARRQVGGRLRTQNIRAIPPKGRISRAADGAPSELMKSALAAVHREGVGTEGGCVGGREDCPGH